MESLSKMEACRICANFYVATSEVDFVPLFEPMEGVQRVLDFIVGEIKEWQLNIFPNDGLPQRICANCFTKFCSIDAFRQECVDAQHKLLEQTTTDQISTSSHLQVNAEGFLCTDNASYLPAEATVEAEVVVGMETINEVEIKAEQNFNHFNVYDPYFQNFENKQEINQSASLGDNMVLETTEDAVVYMPEETSHNVYYQQPVPETIFNKEADCIVQSKTIEAEMNSIVSQDLEEMLQGSIIQTNQQTNKIICNERTEAEEMPNMQQNGEGFKPQVAAAANCVEVEHEEDEEDYDEYDDALNSRLLGNPTACQYCYCRSNGSVDHLIFTTSEALSQHFFDVHDPNLPYTCPYCPQTYKSGKQRDNHVRIVHISVIQTEQCEYCLKNIRSSVEQHQYSCTYVGDWKCDDCGDKFIQAPLHRFRTHQRQHDPTKQLRCNTCGRVFLRRANLEAHERIHKSTNEVLECDECQASFPGEYELKRHKYQAHNGELPVKCDHCYKGFVSIAFLHRHIQHFHPETLDETNRTNDVTTCTNCGTSFSSLHKLRFHLQRPRDENGKCTDTQYTYKERRRQQRQGLYPCPYCSKRFHLKWQQEKHLNTHDARLRPFQCDQCHIRCRTTTELKQHVNVAHLNIKAFSCETCGKSFGYKKDLRDHMLFHAEISIACTETGCDYVCKNDRALNDHIRHKHRLIPCEYCGVEFTRQRLTTHLRNVHRSEIEVEVGENVQIRNEDDDVEKVRVELVNGDHANTLALQEQPANTYKPLMGTEEHMEQFFMGTLIDPDHEIIVT